MYKRLFTRCYLLNSNKKKRSQVGFRYLQLSWKNRLLGLGQCATNYVKFYTKGTRDSYLSPVSCQAQFLRCEDSLRGKSVTAVVGGPVVAPGLYPHWAQELLVGAVEKYLR